MKLNKEHWWQPLIQPHSHETMVTSFFSQMNRKELWWQSISDHGLMVTLIGVHRSLPQRGGWFFCLRQGGPSGGAYLVNPKIPEGGLGFGGVCTYFFIFPLKNHYRWTFVLMEKWCASKYKNGGNEGILSLNRWSFFYTMEPAAGEEIFALMILIHVLLHRGSIFLGGVRISFLGGGVLLAFWGGAGILLHWGGLPPPDPPQCSPMIPP